MILDYQRGRRDFCLDVGCGPGIVSEYLAPYFNKVVGIDTSAGMIGQATSRLTSVKGPLNIEYRQSMAEDISFLENSSVDIAVSGQAAHWFNFSKFFPEMKRIVKKGGSLAIWSYGDPVIIHHPEASRILTHYSYANDPKFLGPYWEQPGRSIVRRKYQDIQPPLEDWEDIRRTEYEPDSQGPQSGEGTMFLTKRMTLGDFMDYFRTYSSYHNWHEKHLDAKAKDDGGDGDVVDDCFEDMRKAEPSWRDLESWKNEEILIEWRSGLLLARRK